MKVREVDSVLFDRYKIVSVAYSGTMSNVYKVHDERLGRDMCLKEVNTGSGSKRDLIKYNSLIKEANIMRQLSYSTIPRVTEFLRTEDNTAIYLMDWVDGETTQSIMKRIGVIPLQYIIRWGIELCRTIGYLHGSKNPVIYRDLKPSNIMIEAMGKPQEKLFLIDFGASEVITEDNTNQDMPIGTPGYAHPDQRVPNSAYSKDWDIHAFGVVLFAWYTGHPVVRERVWIDKDTGKKKKNLDYLTSYDINDYSEQTNNNLRDIILKCTSVPTGYSSIEEVQYDLEHLSEDTVKSVAKAKRNINMSIAALVVAGILTLGSLCGLVYSNSAREAHIEDERQQAYSLGTPESYITYIKDSPKDIDAYIKLVNAMTKDGVFSTSDAHSLSDLVSSNIGDLKDSDDYPKLAQTIGEAYFYYYAPIDKVSNYQLALQWLNQAKGINNDKIRMEILISTFQSNIQANITAGSDAGKYGQFYKELLNMKVGSMPPLIQAMYYKTLTDLVSQYSYQLKQDGISEGQMRDTIQLVNNYLAKGTKDSSARVSSLISEIQASLPSADSGIEQVFTGRDGER